MSKIIPLFLVIAVGVFYQFLQGKEKAQALRSKISELVLYYLLPALTFKIIFETHLSFDYAKVAIVSWIVILSGIGVSFLLSKLLNIPEKYRVGFILGATFSNATYLGIPLLSARLGTDAIPTAFFYDFLGLTPALYFFTSFFSSYFGKASTSTHFSTDSRFTEKPKQKNPFKALISLPPVWAVFLGILAQFLIKKENLPSQFLEFLDLMGKPVAPLMMISVGLGLSTLKIRELKWVIPAVGIKLLILPSLIYFLIPFLQFENTIVAQASLMEAGLPTMLLTVIVCEAFGFDSKILSQIIVLSTALCIFTLNIW